MDQLVAIREELARRKIVLDENWPARDADDVFQVRLSTLLVANKSDLDSDPDEGEGARRAARHPLSRVRRVGDDRRRSGAARALMHLHRDVIAGTLFILIGWFALRAGRVYPIGSAMHMGPGYFPAVLGALLILLGAWIGLRAFRSDGWERIVWGWKPLAWITASMLLFGFLMPRFGLIPALAVMLPVAAAAGRDFRFKEVLLLTVVMCAFAGGVFVYALKLPYRLFAY